MGCSHLGCGVFDDLEPSAQNRCEQRARSSQSRPDRSQRRGCSAQAKGLLQLSPCEDGRPSPWWPAAASTLTGPFAVPCAESAPGGATGFPLQLCPPAGLGDLDTAEVSMAPSLTLTPSLLLMGPACLFRALIAVPPPYSRALSSSLAHSLPGLSALHTHFLPPFPCSHALWIFVSV